MPVQTASASIARLQVCTFLNPTMNDVAVPGSTTIISGTESHVIEQNLYSTTGSVPQITSA